MVPVFFELKKSRHINVKFISTGQHTSMFVQVLDFFGLKPDIELNVMQPNQSLSELTAALSLRLDELFKKEKCDTIIVQGDTTTAFVASLIAFYNNIKVAHVEAGLRTSTKGIPFPEEMNRRLISKIADHHFAPTQSAYNVLKSESIENIHLVGNTVIDSLFLCLKKNKEDIKTYTEKYDFLKNFSRSILITCHRRESFGAGILQICLAIKKLAKNYPDFVFIYPVHYNPNVQDAVYAELGKIENIRLIDPVPYNELVYLINECYLVMTDSGGIQEEAPSLNKPVVVLREETERTEGVDAGCAVLAGVQTENILRITKEIIEDKKLYERMANVENPYGDGRASQRIANIIEKRNEALINT